MAGPRVKTSLESYLELIQTEGYEALRARPFDYSWKTLEGEPFKNDPPFGEEAKKVTINDINEIPLSPTIDDVEKIKKRMGEVVKDLDGMPLPTEDAQLLNKIKAGYIFNAYNLQLASLFETTKNDPQRHGELAKKAKMIRIIGDDCANNTDIYLTKIKKEEEVTEVTVRDYIQKEVEGKLDRVNKEHASQQEKVRLAGYTDSRIAFYGSLGKEMIDATYGVQKSQKSGQDQVVPVRQALVAAWTRVAINIQKDVSTDLYTGMHDLKIRQHQDKNEFSKFASFTKDILSIQKNYEARWLGLKTNLSFFKDKESQVTKAKIVTDINTKLVELIRQYPAKTRQEIVDNMKEFLTKKDEELGSKHSDLSTQIHRIIVKLDAKQRLEKEEQAPKQASNAAPEEIQEKKNWFRRRF